MVGARACGTQTAAAQATAPLVGLCHAPSGSSSCWHTHPAGRAASRPAAAQHQPTARPPRAPAARQTEDAAEDDDAAGAAGTDSRPQQVPAAPALLPAIFVIYPQAPRALFAALFAAAVAPAAALAAASAAALAAASLAARLAHDQPLH